MVINGHRVSFGTDFEVFVREQGTNNFIPARLVTTGTKDAYEQISGGSIHADGLAVELGINKSYTAAGFVSAVQTVLDELRRRCDTNGWYISEESLIEFTPEQWSTFTPEEIEVGCNPDFSIYNAEPGQRYTEFEKQVVQLGFTLVPNPSPTDKLGTKRTVGGHLHIGWMEGIDNYRTDNFHNILCKGVVRALDSVFSPSTSKHGLGVDAIGCKNRTAFYGGYGCYRPKPYGVEYRGADSRWLLDPVKCRQVMDNVSKMLSEQGKSGNILKFFLNDKGGLNATAA